jgi:hypothetical protein
VSKPRVPRGAGGKFIKNASSFSTQNEFTLEHQGLKPGLYLLTIDKEGNISKVVPYDPLKGVEFTITAGGGSGGVCGEKKKAIDEAKEVIYGDREKTYGAPSKNLLNIAALWENYLYARGLLDVNGHGLQATDVAIMQVLLKVARHANKYKRDNIVDGIGYLALVDRITERN